MTRVLIADDEKLSLNGIASIVNDLEGFETTALASNGLQAFEMLKENRPDILITDIRMPQKDGIWLIDQIDEEGYDIPIIVISAYDDQKYIKTAIRSRNVYDYLFKPFVKKELEDTLKSIVSYHQKNKVSPEKTIGISNLAKAISGNDFSLIKDQLHEYFLNNEESLSDLKNRIYGWIMYIHYDVFPINRAIPLFTRNAMKEVYGSQDKKQLEEVTTNYLKGCCERYVGDQEITLIVSECLRIIHSEMANSDLNMNYCAYKLNVTPNYLSSRFSRDMQQSFSAYLNNLRMEKAKELLGNIGLKIYEVAEMIGFSDVAYFNRVFKDKYNQTPMQYRQKMFDEEETQR
ncbi:MAG: response regulator [Erysipelotrichaceae bacterium]|nr:response regulator [Erysipelotrichaceae bacterium]